MPEYYEIKLKELRSTVVCWFAGLELTQLDENETLISGQLADQAALHGVFGASAIST